MKDHAVRIVDRRDMDTYCAYLEDRLEAIKAENLKLITEREDQEAYIRTLEKELKISPECGDGAPFFMLPDSWKSEGEA